jgi:hypothetical protein
MGELKNIKFYAVNLKGNDDFRGLGVPGRIILKLILQ